MDGDTERIDRDWHDQSDYFDAGDHMRDFGSRFQRYRAGKVLDLAGPAATDGVLDLGCGWGTMSFALAPLAREVVGLDFSERAVAGCDRELERQGLSNVVFRVGDARASGLAAGSFDRVVAADLFEHLYPEDSGGGRGGLSATAGGWLGVAPSSNQAGGSRHPTCGADWRDCVRSRIMSAR